MELFSSLYYSSQDVVVSACAIHKWKVKDTMIRIPISYMQACMEAAHGYEPHGIQQAAL